MQIITPCLWFDDQAEEAALFYTEIFRNSRITSVSRYGEAGKEVHGKPPGSVMTVAFELEGQPFLALNGGPHFHFTEAISLSVGCETQEEVDEAASKGEAVEWAKHCPAADNEVIEVRQMQEMADFPADVQKAAAGYAEMQETTEHRNES